jgi:hypothetical protein
MHFQEGQISSKQHTPIFFVQEHIPGPQDFNPPNNPQKNQLMIGKPHKT